MFCFFLWNVITAFTSRPVALALGALPVVLLVGLAALLGSRGVLLGVHLAVWELVVAVLAAVLALLSGVQGKGRGPSSRRPGGRRGLRER